MKPRFLSRAATVNEEFADSYDVVRALLTDRGPGDHDIASDATERALRQCHESRRAELWAHLADEAEYHGVAPSLEPMITVLARKAPDVVPDDVRRVFVALASRQRRAALARERCIDRLLAAFATANIPIILLKGAALAHRIYASPTTRPMVDIDVLIDPADTQRAVKAAVALGYAFASRHGSRFAGRMHHLPEATITQSGFRISLEIHLDTMSPNHSDSVTFATLTAKPEPFQRCGGPDGQALGHTDMLRHLARHTFEPARRVRLVHLYDLWRYQTAFHDEIDWHELEIRFPQVIIVLQLVSQVFSRQHVLKSQSVSASEWPESRPADTLLEPFPAGAGFGMVPLSEIAAADIGLVAKLAAMFNPPAWWLHGFYGVPTEQSLLLCRTVWHPLTLARWLFKRLAAVIGLSRPLPRSAIVAGHTGIAEVRG